MQHILANITASVTELKLNTSEVIANAQDEAVAVLNRNKPTAYIVSPALYEKLLEALDELTLIETVKTRLKDEHKAIEISLDDL